MGEALSGEGLAQVIGRCDIFDSDLQIAEKLIIRGEGMQLILYYTYHRQQNAKEYKLPVL